MLYTFWRTYSRCNSEDKIELDIKDPIHRMEIQLKFLHLNRGSRFDQEFLRETGLDGYLPLTMSDENIIFPDRQFSDLLNFNLINYKGVGKTDREPI